MSSIGERIRDLRKDCGLTLEKFGARLGVSKVAISKLENGVSSLTPQMAKSIIREFGVCEEWLVNGNPPKYPELNKEQQLHAWADKVLADSPESFRFRFVNALSRLPDEWWWLVEKAAIEILAEYDPEKADEFRKASAAANQNVTDTTVGNITDANQETSHTTYEVGTNFGAVGDGATVINHDS